MPTVAFWFSLVLVFAIPWENTVLIENLGTAIRITGLVVAAFWVATVVVTGRFRKPHSFHVAVYLFVLWNLGMLMVIVGCSLGAKPVEVVSISPIDNPDLGERAATASSVPAFPGAEGFGANSVGGRGGRVIEVTNLDDSGPGSLRAAVEAEGPRIVVFRTGGTIMLQSTLVITKPYITIAGQTAPGGGIALRLVSSIDGKTLLVRNTHDVVIRYIRVRPGPTLELSYSRDGLSNHRTHDVIVDHCSLSWAVDENGGTWYDTHDITIQWSIISEGLYDSTHVEGPHSMGLLFGSDGAGRITLHHSLFAHNNQRNPVIVTAGVFDCVNNVIYNFGEIASAVHGNWGLAPTNYVGNFVKRGPDSRTSIYGIDDFGGNPVSIYVRGNIGPYRPDESYPEENIVRPSGREYITSTRHQVPTVTTTSAFEAYDQVLADAGATIGLDSRGNSYWRRDTVDQRLVNEVISGTGRIIDDPSEVGGWPELAAGTAPLDTDHDGMPDEWETLYGFDLCVPSDGPGDADGDGYTNVEEYLNGTDPINNGGAILTVASPTTIGYCLLFLPIVLRR